MHKLLRFILVICAAPLLAPPAKGEVRVPSIIGDNMVVQQGLKACLWGTAQPGERVTVSIAGRTVRAITDAQGQSGQELALHLTAIDDFDITYFNGTRVGATGNETPNSYMVPRRYTVPGSLVHAGRNVIAVRVFDRAGEGD